MVSSSRRTYPGFFAILWAVAACATYSAIAVAGLLVSNELRLENFADRVQSELQQGRIPQAKAVAREMVERATLDFRLARFVEGAGVEAKPDTILKYVLTAESVRSGQLSRLLTTKAWIDDEAPFAPNSIEKDEILSGISDAQAILEKVEFEGAARKEMEASAEQLAREYMAVAQRFGALLNLQPVIPTPGASTLPVTQSGYLAGLPRLVGLSEEIPDVDNLASAISSAGGKVTLEGPNVATAFDSEMTAIRDLTRGIVESREELRSSEELSTKHREKLKKELDVVARRVTELVSREVTAYSTRDGRWYDRMPELEEMLGKLSAFVEHLASSGT